MKDLGYECEDGPVAAEGTGMKDLGYECEDFAPVQRPGAPPAVPMITLAPNSVRANWSASDDGGCR